MCCRTMAARQPERPKDGSSPPSQREATPIPAGGLARLLNLELFFSPVRADAHLRAAASGARVLWYLYDFLPFLRPELFTPGSIRRCMRAFFAGCAPRRCVCLPE